MSNPNYYIGTIGVRSGTAMISDSEGADGDVFLLSNDEGTEQSFFVRKNGTYVQFSATDIFDLGSIGAQDGKVIKGHGSRWTRGDVDLGQLENIDSVEQIYDYNNDLSEYMLFIEDQLRNGKILSLESTTFRFAESQLNNNDWLRIGEASDSDIGFIMPFDGTIIRCSGFCDDVKSLDAKMRVYVNETQSGIVLNFDGSSSQKKVDGTLNIDFSKGDKIRVRADISGGWIFNRIEDTNIVLWVKWRKA